MGSLSRRDWLLSCLAAGWAWTGRPLPADDAPRTAPRSVDADIRDALQAADLSLRFKGSTRDEFLAWQTAFRARLEQLLGDSTPPVKWTETVESRVEFADHVRLELLLQAGGYPDLPVYLLLPSGAEGQGGLPGMVCIHGHGEYGHHPVAGRTDLPGVKDVIASANYDYGLQFVRRGYAVAAPCLIPFGRRVERERYGSSDPCAITFLRMQALGQLPITANLRDCRWAASLLAGREEVDGNRIGCAGLSYGGRMSMLTAAMEPRIRAAVVSGALNLIQERLQARYSCGSQIIPGLLKYGDHPEIGGLIAPRPSVWEVGSTDSLIRSPYAEDFRNRLREIYAAAGAADQLQFDDFEGGHRWNGDVAFLTLDRILKN